MKQGKRILASCLAIALLLGLSPDWGGLIPTAQAADGTTIDAFGIQMTDWTAAEKAQAEGEAPIGVGYQTKTSLLTHAELYVSLGYDRDTRLTGVKDWNKQNQISDMTSGVTGYSNSGLYQEQAPYTFVETAAMDAYNSGKDEYIANLAYNRKSDSIQLFVTTTDGQNKVVAGPVTVASGNSIKQLRDLDTYELRGAMTVAAGDFDGDGKDTIVVYLPTVDSNVNPAILEYSVSDGLNKCRSVTDNVFSMLKVSLKKLGDHDLENQPMVSLVAEDVDKDGFDELVITAGMNNVDGDNYVKDTPGRLGSQLFIYDLLEKGWSQSYHLDLSVNKDGTAEQYNGRIVWASSTVGNLNPSTDTSDADYPEILSAGFVDRDYFFYRDSWVIGIDLDDIEIGVVAVQVNPQNPIKESHSIKVGEVTANNQVCNYQPYLREPIKANGFTKGGFYADTVNSLLQVQAFSDKGAGAEDSVFISGSVYQINQDGVQLLNTPKYFNGHDQWANTTMLTNTNVQSVVAGNFDGNNEGREQLIFVTSLRQSGKNNSYSQMWYLYNGASSGAKDDDWKSGHSGYLVSHKGAFYMTLNAVDPDNDSTIVTLEGVTRSYSQPDVLAILEAPPYFQELGKTGNGKTSYGTNQSSGSSEGSSFTYSMGMTFGYDWSVLGTGFGMDWAIKDSLTRGNTDTQKRTWSIEYANDSGKNAVVVYRCPVISYLYKDQNNKNIIINKNGMPTTSIIPVEDYNKAAKEYKLNEITDAVVDLGEPGNPSTYRSSTAGLTNVILGDETTGVQSSPDGWVQYSGQGTVQQSLSESAEHAKIFNYALDISASFWGKTFGAKFGVSTGFQCTTSSSMLNGTGVSKSGSVVSKKVEGYDFQWKFATWQAKVNANTVPVLGFLVQDVVAPPSPAQNLTVDTVSQDSVTLSWDIGARPAQQYRIYRVLEESNTSYVLVGATDGTATSYTLTGLQAGATYTYVVRGVSYDDAGNAKVSVDSSPVTVRTTAATAADVTITLSGVDEEGVLHSSGDSASITANVYNPEPSTSISYQWQVRASGNARWMTLTNGKGNTNIGTVTGATGSSLSLEKIEKSLDGGALRCVVTVSSKDGTPEYYYSPIAALSLSGSQTVTQITVAGADGGTGDLETPYVARSGYTTSTEEEQTTTFQSPVTAEANGVSYTVYSAEQDGQTKYVGIAFIDDEAQYVSVTKSGETYTVGAPLTADEIQYHYYNENGEDTVYQGKLYGFDGYTTETVTKKGNTYLRVYQFSGGENNVPETEYWYCQEDGQYYIREGSQDAGYTFTLVHSQPTGDLRTVYYSEAEDLIITDPVDKVAKSESDETGTGETGTTETDETETADPSDGYEKYEVYRSGGLQGYSFETVIWAVGDRVLKLNNTPYADRSALEMVLQSETVTQKVWVTRHIDGTELALTADVSIAGQPGLKVYGQVDFIITNIDTGSKTTLVAAGGVPVTWRAPAAGLYRITAVARSSTITIASSSSCYYYARAVDTTGSTTEYRLLAQQNGSQVTEIAYNGQPVTLTLQSRVAAGADGTPGAWRDVEGDVSFTVNGQGIQDNSYIPDAAGTYDFVASVDGTQVATTRLEISKLPLTLAPMWEGMEQSSINSAPQDLSDIQIRVTGTMVDQDEALLSQALAVSCALYDENGKNQNTTGAYDVNLVWTTDDTGTLTEAARKIQSRYEVTLEQEALYSLSGSVVVSFRSGENGSLSAMYRDESQTELPIGSSTGTSIPNEYSVIFTATPHGGYVVDQWTVNGQVVTDGVVSYPGGGQTLTLDLQKYKELDSVLVGVTFANSSNTIQFRSDEHGTVTAVDGSGNQLSSGSSVAFGSSVTFTAAPAEGYMVDHWTVDNVAYVWPGTKENYRQSTLTLEDLSAGHHVAVFFAPEAYTQVAASVVDTAGTASSAATLSVTDTDGKAIQAQNGVYNVRQDTSLVFTAHPVAGDSNTTVREWQTSTNGTSWSTVTGSGGQSSLTIYNPSGEKLYVRAVVDTAQSFTLNWNIQMSGTGEVPEDAAITAVSNGVTLTAGAAQSAYIPVDFTLALDDAYYVVGWSDNVAGSGKAARLESLTADTTVTVTIAKKPVVTIDSVKGGTAIVTGTVNGRPDQTIISGGYVDYGTELVVVLKPDTGYEVGELDGIVAAYTDGTGSTTDDKTYSIQNVQSDLTVTQAWSQIPTYEVTYSVVDTNGAEEGGTNGTLSASVERKGMDAYQDDAFTSGENVYKNSVVTFTAQPAEGYRVQEWRVNDEVWQDKGANYIGTTLTLDQMSADAEVTVQYMEVGNKVTVSAGDNGSITSAMVGSTEQVGNIEAGFTLAAGASVVIAAQPDTGYEVEQWLVNGTPVEGEDQSTFTYVAETAHSGAAITVTFRQVEYAVSWDGDHGTVTAQGYENGSAQIRGGTQVIFTAAPDQGYAVTGWTVNGQEVTQGVSGNTLTWTVPNGQAADPAVTSYEIRPVFGRGSYAVAIQQPSHGTITADRADLGAVTGDTEVTFTAAPEDGYMVVGWTVNGQTTDSRSTTYSVQIKENTTVSAVIVPDAYLVTYGPNDPAWGSVSAEGGKTGSASVAYGGNITFTAQPNQYYYVSGWQVDGALVENTANQNTFTLMGVKQAHTVTAVFAAAISYEVGYEAGSNGSLSATVNGQSLTLTPGQHQNVWGGGKLVFTALPANNYMLAGWEISTDGGTSYVAVTKDNLDTLGLSATHPLANVLTVNSLRSNLSVRASYEPYVGYAIPESGSGYTVTVDSCSPADAGAASEIRQGGDVTFTVAPEAGKGISRLIVNGVDCLATSAAEKQSNGLTVVKNGDGSYTITIENVQQEIQMEVAAVSGKLVIDCGAHGTVTVQKNGAAMQAGDTVQKGDVLTVTASADSGYRLSNLTVNGTGISSGGTYTVAADGADVTVKAVFTEQSSGGGGGGGGGGTVIASYSITVSESVHGQVTVSKASGAAGDKITVTALPDEGYLVSGVTVAGKDGKELSLTEEGSGRYTFIMPEYDVVVTGQFRCDGGAHCPSAAFGDLDTGAWYHDAVDYVIESGLMAGVGGNRFDPDGVLNRAMIVTILWRMEQMPQSDSAMTFTDVADGAWYTEAVRWAAAEGIVNGYGEGKFAPDDTVTREQLATILYRYAQYKGYDTGTGGDLSAFSDAGDTGDYAVSALTWAVEKGIVNGVGGSTLLPQGSATRTQAAAMLMRFASYAAE